MLSDVEFLGTMSEYFTAIFRKKVEPQAATDEEDCTKPKEVTEEESEKIKELQVPVAMSLHPKIKMEAGIENFRLALIEDVNAPEPQALTLKVNIIYVHVHCICFVA